MSLVKSLNLNKLKFYCSAWQNQCKKIYIHSTVLVKKKKRQQKKVLLLVYFISVLFCLILPSEPKPWVEF